MSLELLMVGLLIVGCSASPFYGALGLVCAAGAGCVVLVGGGMTFLSLVLFLIYLGGMMVVFAYSAALVAEPYPSVGGGGWYSTCYVVVGAVVVSWLVWGDVDGVVSFAEWGVVGGEWWGACELLNSGGWSLVFVGWALLLMLFVALGVVGHKEGGTLRAV